MPAFSAPHLTVVSKPCSRHHYHSHVIRTNNMEGGVQRRVLLEACRPCPDPEAVKHICVIGSASPAAVRRHGHTGTCHFDCLASQPLCPMWCRNPGLGFSRGGSQTLSCCAALGKSLHLSGPQSSQLKHGGDEVRPGLALSFSNQALLCLGIKPGDACRPYLRPSTFFQVKL